MAIKGGRPDNRQCSPHLLVRDVDAAVEFCQRAFGATLLYRAGLPDGGAWHAQLRLGESTLLITREDPSSADVPLRSPETLGGSSAIVELYVDDVDAVVQRAEAAGARVSMPLSETFYGDRRAHLADPSGHIWAVATVREVLTPEEIQSRMLAHLGGGG